mmetsp:Transcript_10828/g.23203  ORF Transcript_10828/g.23203 Transcript_10828/m.23203 type:complete len:176 (-) Transcript_10828:544-1071(-)
MDQKAVNALVQAALDPLRLTLADHEAKIQMLMEDIRVFAPDKIRNLAAQILLFYCGDQPVPRDRLDRRRKHFQGLEEGKVFEFDETFNQKKDYTKRCLTALEWAVKFDGMIENRDGVIHFGDWDSLRAVVVPVRAMLLRHPTLEVGIEDEIWVINNFEMLRSKPLTAVRVAKAGK